MKKIFYNIILLCGSCACTSVHTEGEQEVTKGKDTVAKVHVEVSSETNKKPVTADTLIFQAHGTEPGWFVQLYTNKLRAVLDYGKDSVIIEDKFSGINGSKNFKYNKNNLELIISTNSCTDEGSGETLPKEVTVNWKNKSYKGCGKFLN